MAGIRPFSLQWIKSNDHCCDNSAKINPFFHSAMFVSGNSSDVCILYLSRINLLICCDFAVVFVYFVYITH